MGTEAWEEARILNGVPVPGRELTDLYNPLEAGLLHAVSLAKGCYVGQETLSKVHNTNGALRAALCDNLPASVMPATRMCFEPLDTPAGSLACS